MSKSLIAIGVIGLFVVILGFSGCSSYNKMVSMNEEVTASWQQVENQYQRRMDLIPNLVKTVEGYANFEKSTLKEVVDARSKATGINVDPSKLDPESIQKFQEAQGNLSGALSRLLVVIEKYPDLKAEKGFSDLRVQLEQTENRIAIARMDFNTISKEYNVYVQKFPAKIWAYMFGFEKRGYFEAKEGAENAPEVQFNIK